MIANSCSVLFDNIPVGYLAYLDDSGFATFEYTSEWQKYGFSLSPLHLPLTNNTFTFRTLPFETYRGLPAVFADQEGVPEALRDNVWKTLRLEW
ncbi:HipA N-terminal domain-containing protein [Proteus sp. fly-1013]|uniref:HipA N-terminal domain-containing protein n=1 Tax=Proteus sp. fly-1013 TaxID=3136673 RepID=UPI0032DAF360